MPKTAQEILDMVREANPESAHLYRLTKGGKSVVFEVDPGQFALMYSQMLGRDGWFYVPDAKGNTISIPADRVE